MCVYLCTCVSVCAFTQLNEELESSEAFLGERRMAGLEGVGKITVGAEKALGFEYVLVEKDCVIIKAKVSEKNVQPYGLLHGGVSVVLAESCASIGSFLNIDASRHAVGQEISASHIAPAFIGTNMNRRLACTNYESCF